jgi:DNA-binding transcriptional MerR regulator
MTDRTDTPGMPPPSQGVYGITVAAELTGIPVQSLRLYERHGLLSPARSDGGTRRYSADDLARLQRISELLATGVNLAGVARILDLQDDNAALLAANQALGAGAKKKRSEPKADKS